MVQHQIINGKDIYIVEEHHHVLEPWAIYRERNTAPILISLDHHTDCNFAFLNHSRCEFEGENGEVIAASENYRRSCVEQINYNDLHTVRSAIENLKHDEHIDTAIKSEMIRNAFIINYENRDDDPLSFLEENQQLVNFPHLAMLAAAQGIETEVRSEGESLYPESENGMYIIGAKCWVGTHTEHPNPCDDSCKRPHYDQAIESVYLDDKLNTINEMMPGLIEDNQFTQEYILDIDLDYFHTVNSINPHDHNTFYNLIRNSKIITIATEPLCVEGGRYENDEINSESLLDALLNHIEHALSPTTIVE
ncbi:UPF0489 family protein [Bacillus cereus]|nr:UPF0489 family protein [Bacillus cereus]